MAMTVINYMWLNVAPYFSKKYPPCPLRNVKVFGEVLADFDQSNNDSYLIQFYPLGVNNQLHYIKLGLHSLFGLQVLSILLFFKLSVIVEKHLLCRSLM